MEITLTQFVSLDGVYQGPGAADEDRTDGFERGGWFVPHMDDAFAQQASDWLDLADGLLLGRRTYEAFAEAWPAMDPDDPFTERMNSLPKYVASGTLKEGTWDPTTLLGGDAVSAVREIKSDPGRELQLHGSARLSQSLLEAGLIDRIRLVVSPVVVGQGRKLFADLSRPLGFSLAEQQVTSTGVIICEYKAEGLAPTADYEGGASQ